MRRVLFVLIAAFVIATSSAFGAVRLPKVLTQEARVFQERPATISYTGDGTGIIGGADGTSVHHLGHLHWTTYNREAGSATGLVWLDNCTPDCARGRFSPSVVQVRASDPTHGHFRLLTLRYGYHGRRYVDRRVAQYYRGSAGVPGYWAYAICGIQYGAKC